MPYAPLFSPKHATRPAHLILLGLSTRITFGVEYRSLSSSLCSLQRMSKRSEQWTGEGMEGSCCDLLKCQTVVALCLEQPCRNSRLQAESGKLPTEREEGYGWTNLDTFHEDSVRNRLLARRSYCQSF
jgi:hypothetical protein